MIMVNLNKHMKQITKLMNKLMLDGEKGQLTIGAVDISKYNPQELNVFHSITSTAVVLRNLSISDQILDSEIQVSIEFSTG